jgi:aspartyl protease family protein
VPFAAHALHRLTRSVGLAAMLTLGATAALAQPAALSPAKAVTLSGMLGGKALLIVDGAPPKAVAVGQSHQGVKVLSTQGDQAVLEFGGRQVAMRVGDAPASVGAAANGPSSGTRITMTAGSGGHFFGQGLINGRPVQLMVDTGATSVSLGVEDAQRIGLNYKTGQEVRLSTANGVAQGWRVKLNTVRLGDVEVFEVDAVVSSGSMPFVLLGNSFLTRFQMTRTNDQLVLVKRY